MVLKVGRLPPNNLYSRSGSVPLPSSGPITGDRVLTDRYPNSVQSSLLDLLEIVFREERSIPPQ
jgi:hypothetical protein